MFFITKTYLLYHLLNRQLRHQQMIYPFSMHKSDETTVIATSKNWKLPLILVGILMPLYAAHADKGLSLEQLMRFNLEQLRNIKVMGASKYEQKQHKVPAAVSVITRSDIRAYGWRTVSEALASLPGVYSAYDYRYDYAGTRGFSLLDDFNTRVLVLINGIRINDATYDHGQIGRELPLDIDLIERIEFIPGPGSAVYGQNAMLAVVNIITRKGSGIRGGELSSSYQTAEGMVQERLSLGKKFDSGVDALVSFSGLQSRGADRFFDFGASGVSALTQRMDGEDLKQGFAHITYKSFSFDFIYGNRHKGDPTSSFFSDPLTRSVLNTRHLQAQLQYNDSFINNTLDVLARVYVGRNHLQQAFVAQGVNQIATGPSSWHGAELRLLSTAINNHSLMLGIEYQNNTSIRQTFENITPPEVLVVTNSPVVRVGVYGQDEWRITDTLTATVGLRYDYNGWIGSRLSPRAGLVWQASDKTVLKALYGRAHRAPNSYERDFSTITTLGAPNSGLRGETIDTAEIVADHQPQPNMNVRASAYFIDMFNVIALDINPIDPFLSIYGQAPHRMISKGVELSLDKTWDWGGRFRSSFGFQDAEQHGAHLKNSPYHLGKINFIIPIPLMKNLHAGYELQYYGARETKDGAQTDSYVLSNLNLVTDVRWMKSLEASLSVYNMFNENYQHPAGGSNWQDIFWQPGRTVRFRLDYRF
ncbi:MAG: TonB-dependent receptor [Nitrosomonas sp.]|nr:MAG: TonB-dependent receptor [Nitrosomonas sp.]